MKAEELIKILKDANHHDLENLKQADLGQVLTTRDEHGKTIAHRIAEAESSQTMINFLTITLNYPHLINQIFTTKCNRNAHLGHYIAYHQSTDALDYFLNIASQHLQAHMQYLLTSQSASRYHMGHHIIEQHTFSALQRYIRLILDYAGPQYSEILQCRNKHSENMIELILASQKSLGAAIFEILNNPAPAGKHTIFMFSEHKEAVLGHISTLSLKQRLSAIEDSLNPNTELGQFFYYQRGLFKPSTSAGTLKYLGDMQDEAKSELNRTQQYSSNTAHYATAPHFTLFTPQPSDQLAPVYFEPLQQTATRQTASMNTNQFNQLMQEAPEVPSQLSTNQFNQLMQNAPTVPNEREEQQVMPLRFAY